MSWSETYGIVNALLSTSGKSADKMTSSLAGIKIGTARGVDMNYIGNGDWEDSSCGKVITFGEPKEDDDIGEMLNVWGAADLYCFFTVLKDLTRIICSVIFKRN